MQLFYIENTDAGTLSPEESRHCVRALRKTRGDILYATDGSGILAKLRIENPDPRACTYSVISFDRKPKPAHFIHVAIAPTKQAERIEWFAEKATEIGVHEISLIQCRHSERTSMNTDRILRKIISASKQSGRLFFPKINHIAEIGQVVKNCTSEERYIAHLNDKDPKPLHSLVQPERKYTVLVGPEGDFTAEEVERCMSSGFEEVSLGPNRLRTETAGVVACQILASINYGASLR